MPYIPPSGDNVNFVFSGDYVPPAGDKINFYFGEIASVSVDSISRSSIYNGIEGFNTTIVRWSSGKPGLYRVELGGNAPFQGKLLDSGFVGAHYIIENVIHDVDITTWSGYSGSGDYQINIYIQGDNGLWNV